MKNFMQITPFRSEVCPLTFLEISRSCVKLTAACIALSHSSPHDLLYFATVKGITVVISNGNPALDMIIVIDFMNHKIMLSLLKSQTC
jgi:hypothetical protein